MRKRRRFERRNYIGCVLGFTAHTLKKSRDPTYTHARNPRRNEGKTINRVCKRFFNLEPFLMLDDSRFTVERFQGGEKRKKKKKTLDHM